MTESLADLSVMALDCQATGANPQRGNLLELGWMPVRASGSDPSGISGLKSCLCGLPEGQKIPRAISRITGITEASIESGKDSGTIWQQLLLDVERINSENQMDVCPAVIHFARFETPFLEDLHRRHDPTGPFPFQIVCTHEIAVRLLPDLPRRGLRAIAGYFNHSMPEIKRSPDHVVATAFIWRRMVGMLQENFSVSTLSDLCAWLAETNPAGRSGRIYPMAAEKRLGLPDEPGVYRMLRSNGDLLYIGKAKSLKLRVNSYFRRKAPHAEHILEMLAQARELAYTKTASALEAAMLESDEIKRHSPPYNIALRRRQRRLAFSSKDLCRFSAVSDRHCCVGPLPEGNFLEAVSHFGHWIRRDCRWTDRDVVEKGAALLGLAPDYAPDPDCFKQGLEIFRQAHRELLKNQTPLRFLTGLGAAFWRLKLAAAEGTEADEKEPNDSEVDNDQTQDTDEEYVWTPEAVAISIGRLVMHTAHLVRRARWFCLLSESALTWEAAEKADQLTNLIVLESGSVTLRGFLKRADQIPVPPRFDRPFHSRQSRLSLTTYDRLRVLTTELRRLLSDGRRIELRLSPTATLDNKALKRALRWV